MGNCAIALTGLSLDLEIYPIRCIWVKVISGYPSDLCVCLCVEIVRSHFLVKYRTVNDRNSFHLHSLNTSSYPDLLYNVCRCKSYIKYILPEFYMGSPMLTTADIQ